MRKLAAAMKAQSLATRDTLQEDLSKIDAIENQVDAAQGATDKLNARVGAISSSLMACTSMTCCTILFVFVAFFWVFMIIRTFPK